MRRRGSISEGSVVKVYNARGAILAGVHLSEDFAGSGADVDRRLVRSAGPE